MTKDSKDYLKILLFEDNSADAELVQECLKATGLPHKIVTVMRLSEGLKRLERDAFDLILLDLALPDSRGISTLNTVTKVAHYEVIIVLTGDDNEPLSLEALNSGAQDYLCKDKLSSEILRRTIRYSMERASLLRRVEAHAEEIKHREALLHRIFDANTDAILMLSSDYEIKFLNPAAALLLEATPEALIGEVFPFEINTGEHTELEIPGHDNSTRQFELSTVDWIWEGENARIVILRDITKRHLAERGLQREKERLAVTLDSIADAVISTDSNGVIERMNQEASRLTGVSNQDATGKPLGSVLKLRHPTTGKIIADPAAMLLSSEREEITPELGIPLAGNEGNPLLVTAEMRRILDDQNDHHGCVVVLRDVTSQKKAENELFKAEKLHSISLLAGGIAHDFNNILTAILGNISVVRMRLDADDPNSTKLLAAEKAALQAKSLTQQLLTFSKGGTPVLETTTISQLIEDCAQFILRGSNVKCEIEKAPDLWPVDADKGQIGQVINNLIINADQAMPGGGIIHIRLKNKNVRKSQIPALESGDYVCIEIQDEGTGITPENLKRIFDPYFTTKKDGNGLGLASSYSIVKSHNGLLTVDSKVDEGSTFSIYLPKSSHQPPAEAKEADSDADEGKNTLHHGQGRILVMDDMEPMMMVAGEILTVLGYEVEFATNGQEAIDGYKKAKESGKPFDAVVFDLTVPGGMGGEEASRILLDYDPNLIAIASSGYTTSNVMSDHKNSPFKAVVPKPYRIKEMSDALHRVLP